MPDPRCLTSGTKKTMRIIIAQLLFYPTLVWNLLLCRLLKVRRWWSYIDDGVILGALPFASDVPALVREDVRGVINTCREYDGPLNAYHEAGIRQLHLPTVDFTPPTLEHIRRGVEFIDECLARDEAVYVHCKAGRGRSATLVICWLVATKGLAPREAQAWIQSRRPHVGRRLYERDVVQRFAAERKPDAATDEFPSPSNA